MRGVSDFEFSVSVRVTAALIAVMSVLGAASSACAQSAPASDAGVETADSTEVVVTARKREERLQDVPLSITALSGDFLKESGVSNLEGVASLTPGLSINTSDAEYSFNPVIRGQANLAQGSADPSVSVFWDGIYLAQGGAANVQQLDMQRIEVVKGPQSALYGRNAYSGAINYVSNEPIDQFGFNLTGSLGNDSQQRLQGVINAPIMEGVLSARIAAGILKSDGGYVDSVTQGRAGGYDKRAGQVTLKFTPTSNLTMTGRVYYGNDTFANPAQIANGRWGNCGPKSTYATNPGAYTYVCGKMDPDKYPIEVDTTSNSAYKRHANERQVINSFFRVNWDTRFVDVTSLTGYDWVKTERYADYYAVRAGVPFLLTNGMIVNLEQPFGAREEYHDVSEDLRVSTKLDKPLRLALGGSYYNRPRTRDETIIGIDASPIPAGVTLSQTASRIYLTPDGTPSASALSQTFTSNKQYSGFVSADYDIFSDLTASGEFRRTTQKQILDTARLNSLPNIVEPLGAPISSSVTFNNYRAALTYKPTRDLTFYGSVADGTKGAGFNARAELASERAYKPELNTTYEIGMKSQWWDRKLTFNVSVYHIDAKDLQLVAPSDKPTQVATVIKNFGGMRTNGFEAELGVRPSPWFDASLGAALADAKFTSGTYDYSLATYCTNAPGFCDPSRVISVPSAQGARTVVNLQGLQVPEESKWQFNASMNARAPAPYLGTDYTMYVGVDGRYESRQYANQLNVGWFGPRKLLNMRVGVTDKKVNLYLWMKNILDDHTPTNAHSSTWLNTFQQVWTIFLPTPRTFGLTVEYNH